jgi:hypothetical protein
MAATHIMAIRNSMQREIAIVLRRQQLTLAFGALLVATAGCEGQSTPVAVQGTVTLDGEPLPTGKLSLDPLSELAGQRRDITIEDGIFALPANEGVLPGLDFKVSIKAFKKTGKKYPNADMSVAFDEEVQYVPETYNSSSTLQIKVSPDAEENHYAFDLVSRPE